MHIDGSWTKIWTRNYWLWARELHGLALYGFWYLTTRDVPTSQLSALPNLTAIERKDQRVLSRQPKYEEGLEDDP